MKTISVKLKEGEDVVANSEELRQEAKAFLLPQFVVIIFLPQFVVINIRFFF